MVSGIVQRQVSRWTFLALSPLHYVPVLATVVTKLGFSVLSGLSDSGRRGQHDHTIHHLRTARLVRRDHLDGDEGKAQRAAGVTSHLTEQELQDLVAFMLALPIAA
jgi:hypothetical protein